MPEYSKFEIGAAKEELGRIHKMAPGDFYQYLAENDWDETVEPLCPGPTRSIRNALSKNKFFDACLKVFGAEGVPGTRKLVEIVYEDNHAYGYREVVLKLMDYEEVIEQIKSYIFNRPMAQGPQG